MTTIITYFLVSFPAVFNAFIFSISFLQKTNLAKMPKPQNWFDRMKLLLNSGIGADCCFLVGKESSEKELLAAHKSLLISASDVFEAMFKFEEQSAKRTKSDSSTGMIDSVEVIDIEPAAFKVMLNYIYTDEISGLNADNVLSVLYAAKKYIIDGLYKACMAFPISKLNNVFFAFADTRVFEEDFARRCLDFIDENADTLLQSEAFLQIDQNLLCEILGRNQLKISAEIAIWKGALCWADEKCCQNDKLCSGANRRDALGSALYRIRFSLIPSKEFSNKIVPTGVLTKDELISVLLSYREPESSLALTELYPLQFPTEQRSRMSNDRNQKFKGHLMLKIENFSEFARGDGFKDRRLSDYPLNVAGFHWKIVARPCTNFGTARKYLGFYLHCSNPSANKDFKWSVNCSASFVIVPRQNGAKNYCRMFDSLTFSDSSPSLGLPEFMTFEELLDARNGLCCNDSVILSVDVTVEEPSGAVK